MQQCGECDKVYDESEDSRCPYCSGGGEEIWLIVIDKETGEAKHVPKSEGHLYR